MTFRTNISETDCRRKERRTSHHDDVKKMWLTVTCFIANSPFSICFYCGPLLSYHPQWWWFEKRAFASGPFLRSRDRLRRNTTTHVREEREKKNQKRWVLLNKKKLMMLCGFFSLFFLAFGSFFFSFFTHIKRDEGSEGFFGSWAATSSLKIFYKLHFLSSLSHCLYYWVYVK